MGSRTLSVAVAGLLTITVACGDDGGQSQFGPGRIPGSVPNDFPIPARAVVTDSTIDAANHRTEFTLEVDSDTLTVIQFFNIELVSQGYVIDRSNRVSDTVWEIVFSRNQTAGTILISDADGPTGVVVSMNVS